MNTGLNKKYAKNLFGLYFINSNHFIIRGSKNTLYMYNELTEKNQIHFGHSFHENHTFKLTDYHCLLQPWFQPK